MNETSKTWTIIREDAMNDYLKDHLHQDENMVKSYKTMKGNFVITSKRLLFLDQQGVHNPKFEIFMLPLKIIQACAIVDASQNHMDDSSFNLLTNIGEFTINVEADVAINELSKVISSQIM